MKKVAIYAIIAASAIGAGGSIGFGAKKLFGTVLDDYSGFDPSVYNIDGDLLIAAVEEKPTTKEKIASFSVADIVNYSLEKYKRFDESYSYSVGDADAGVTVQKIRAAQIKTGNMFFEESASSGMVGCANRVTQEVGGDSVLLYRTEECNIVDEYPVFPYPANPVAFTLDAYKNAYGKTLDEMFIYTIHKKTILKSDLVANEDGTYTINLALNPSLSTYWYKKQMVSISNLEAVPKFTEVSLVFTLDSDLMLKTLAVNEYFYAKKMGIDAGTRNKLFNKYFPGQHRDIPKLNEAFHYGDDTK